MRKTTTDRTATVIGLAVAAMTIGFGWSGFGAVVVRAVALGVAVSVIVAKAINWAEATSESKRLYRAAKSRYLDALATSITDRSEKSSSSVDSAGTDLGWFGSVPDTEVLVTESAFDTEEVVEETPNTCPPATGDPISEFESAMAEGDWLAAFEALSACEGVGSEVGADAGLQARLRKESMEEIFRRMHSGTVREDVALLAQAVTDIFPESTEGRTLGQVMGVLRRSAGLCPRCARPYRGIAAACHDCLRGTPEEYQIAWDD